jgi:hypothetical protein
MRLVPVCVIVAIAVAAAGAEADDARVRKEFESADYTVTWGDAAAFDEQAELEVGDGNGHGFTLGWMRFHPDKEGVDVLTVGMALGRKLQYSKWPEDLAPVTVRRARMKKEAYIELLRSLAVVDSARLTPRGMGGGFRTSFDDFWVYARVAKDDKPLLDLNWAGYRSSLEAANNAKPAAAVSLARAAVGGLVFEDHEPTDEERRWASAKFARDWKKFADLEKVKGMELSHWWVRERYLIAIGVVGDNTALPALREILVKAPAVRHQHDLGEIDMSHSADRLTYYAINAVTRITKMDVRPRPVEEMDVEATRRKVLELLPESK